MKPRESEPSKDELLAMAYVDGELSDEARLQFEDRLKSESHLQKEVAELMGLAVLARQIAPPEPINYEWERLNAELFHSEGNRVGLLLCGIGIIGLFGWGGFELLRSEIPLWPKLFMSGGIAGLLLLFVLTLRARMRTLPMDPYTEVKR